MGEIVSKLCKMMQSVDPPREDVSSEGATRATRADFSYQNDPDVLTLDPAPVPGLEPSLASVTEKGSPLNDMRETSPKREASSPAAASSRSDSSVGTLESIDNDFKDAADLMREIMEGADTTALELQTNPASLREKYHVTNATKDHQIDILREIQNYKGTISYNMPGDEWRMYTRRERPIAFGEGMWVGNPTTKSCTVDLQKLALDGLVKKAVDKAVENLYQRSTPWSTTDPDDIWKTNFGTQQGRLFTGYPTP